MKNVPVYLIMISFGRKKNALSIIDNFKKSEKPTLKTNFIVIENGPVPELKDLIEKNGQSIIYRHFQNRNKAAAINFAIGQIIAEEEALIICIDNDIKFEHDFLLKYYNTALEKGNCYYFGTSVNVNIPHDLDERLLPYLSGSALGQPDEQFERMKTLMFLGCSYAFYKSQWKMVEGLDERFSPGSTFNLGADESIFQKKLKNADYKPFFIKNNPVEHFPESKLFQIDNILFRQEQNGFTHAFQNIVTSHKVFKLDYFYQLAGYLKKCLLLTFRDDVLKAKMNCAYTKGYFKGFLIYLKAENKKTYL